MSQILRKFISRNPFTEKINKEFGFIQSSELSEKIEKSGEGYKLWKKSSLDERIFLLKSLAENLNKNFKQYAQTITEETGKPILQSEGEVLKSANHCIYYAENLKKFLEPQIIENQGPNKIGYLYQPVGSIYLMTPFNFPFWLIFKAGIPMLCTGNTILSRTSDSTPQIGLLIEKIFQDSGFKQNQFINVFTQPSQLDQICSNPVVQGVSFTGSSQAGANISATASKYVKKSLLELGGSDPFIVLEDADLNLAADLAVGSRLFNCGQVCISAKRFIVNQKVHDEFIQKIIQRVEKYKIGDPSDPSTQLGPMAREDLREGIRRQQSESLKQGGKLYYQRELGFEKGFFQGPSVIGVNKDNILGKEEAFGPVFGVFRSDDDQQAIQIANSSQYGLSSCIISKDVERAEKIGLQLETGSFFVNELVKSDSRIPSGGVKYSGYGRECGALGMREFSNVKSFWINSRK